MRIAMLLSGGVDSSVACKLLKDQGHEVHAFYLKFWLEDELAHLSNCPWEEDLEYVKKVCKCLDVPFKILSIQQIYWDLVVKDALGQIKEGLTPNPDILCNERMKFGTFLKLVGRLADKVATGHYAQIEKEGELYKLKRSPDPIKDQTYFLSTLNQKQLSRALFPIGNFKKEEVRKLAKEFNLPTKDRKDSQGICFLGRIKFKEFIKHHLGEKEGSIIEYETGKEWGKHKGFWYYTIGQREGLGLGHGPWYVVKKNVEKNIVYISHNYEALEKERSEFTVRDLCWNTNKVPKKKNLQVKMRHGPKLNNCVLELLEDNKAQIKLSEKDQGISPGQYAVFYDKDICLGSGIIE